MSHIQSSTHLPSLSCFSGNSLFMVTLCFLQKILKSTFLIRETVDFKQICPEIMWNSNFSHFLLNDPYNVLRGLSTIGFVLGLVLVFRPYRRILEQPSALLFNGTVLYDNVAWASNSVIENTTWANQTDLVSSNTTVTNIHLQEVSSVRQWITHTLQSTLNAGSFKYLLFLKLMNSKSILINVLSK